MSHKNKQKASTNQVSEELSVQVMLALYQTDISTQNTALFGGIAAFLSIFAIVISNAEMLLSSTTLILAMLVISGFWIGFLLISEQKYAQRRRQLDSLRKKYCPNAYEVPKEG